jgi:colanic acid/amylovoran biosynthesis protein
LIGSIFTRNPNSRFIFIPHDYRPNGIGEGPILEYLYSMLPKAIQGQTYLLSEMYSASEIKWISGELDFVVSSRMHLAIAAIGQGTPVFCLEYQGKFRGLFDLLGMPDLVSSMTATPFKS